MSYHFSLLNKNFNNYLKEIQSDLQIKATCEYMQETKGLIGAGRLMETRGTATTMKKHKLKKHVVKDVHRTRYKNLLVTI